MNTGMFKDFENFVLIPLLIFKESAHDKVQTNVLIQKYMYMSNTNKKYLRQISSNRQEQKYPSTT